VVKGLAKLRNRLRHDRQVKYVDVSLFKRRAATPQWVDQSYRTTRWRH